MYEARKGAHRFLTNESERKNPLVIYRSVWKDNIKLNLQKQGF